MQVDDKNDQVEPALGAALDAIGAEAANQEGEQEQKQQQAGPEQPMAGAMGWAMIAKGFGSMVAVGLPEVAPAYTDEACMNWGGAMDALAIKYGWEGGASRFGPEIAVALATFGLAAPVVMAIKARKAQAEQEAARTQPASQLTNGAQVMEAAP